MKWILGNLSGLRLIRFFGQVGEAGKLSPVLPLGYFAVPPADLTGFIMSCVHHGVHADAGANMKWILRNLSGLRSVILFGQVGEAGKSSLLSPFGYFTATLADLTGFITTCVHHGVRADAGAIMRWILGNLSGLKSANVVVQRIGHLFANLCYVW